MIYSMHALYLCIYDGYLRALAYLFHCNISMPSQEIPRDSYRANLVEAH